jgi:hypothetical protein
MATNCWDVKNCGRNVGGSKVAELGVCPAAADSAHNGVNQGVNGGRICWAVTGTLCGGEVQGSFAQKRLSCMSCEFFKQVKGEEGSKFHIK